MTSLTKLRLRGLVEVLKKAPNSPLAIELKALAFFWSGEILVPVSDDPDPTVRQASSKSRQAGISGMVEG